MSTRRDGTAADDGSGGGSMQHALEWTGGHAAGAMPEATRPALVPQAVMPAPRSALPVGAALARMDAPGMATMQVARPREHAAMLREALEEAAAIGEDFWYAWDVAARGGGDKHVEGVSIVGANALMRAYGNCAAWVEMEAETDQHWTLRAHFVDAERCTSSSRLFRQPKQASMGKVEPERALAMSFASGQSKAVRNAILYGVPESLKRRALAAAKEAAAKGIVDGDLPALRAKIVRLFRAIGVEQQRLEIKLGSKTESWGKDEVVQARALYRAITVEGVPAADVFPAPEPPRATVDLGRAKLEGETPVAPPAEPKAVAAAPKVSVERKGRRVQPPTPPPEPIVEPVPEPFECSQCGYVHLPGPCAVPEREPGEDG